MKAAARASPRAAPGTGASRWRSIGAVDRAVDLAAAGHRAHAHRVRENFSHSVSGTDLIVGARTGSVAAAAVLGVPHRRRHQQHPLESVQALAAAPRGGLGGAALARRFAPRLRGARHHAGLLRALSATATASRCGCAKAGRSPSSFDAVIGAEVADALGYRLGQRIVLATAAARSTAHEHADKPFTVVGILARTGTPVDRTVHISLQAMEAIHLDWAGGAPMPGVRDPGRAGAQVRPHAQERDGRAGRPEEPRRGVRGAALASPTTRPSR